MSFKYQIRNCRLQTLSVWKSLKLSFGEELIINIHTSRLCPWVYRRRFCHMDISHFRLPDCATDKKYSSLIGSQNSSLKQNSTYSIQWLTLRQEFTCVCLTYFQSASRKSWVLYRTAALCENVGARNLIGRMKHIVGYLGI